MIPSRKSPKNFFLTLEPSIKEIKSPKKKLEAEYLITIEFNKFEMDVHKNCPVVFGISGGKLVLKTNNCALQKRRDDPFLRGLNPILTEKSKSRN